MSIRFWVLVLVVGITAGILAVVWMTWDTGEKQRVVHPSQVEEKKDVVPPLLSEADVDISAEGIELTQGASGKLEWTLKALRGDYDQDSDRIMLSRPDMVYFMGKDRTRIRVTAGEGSVTREQDSVVLERNVTAEYDAYTVYSQTLDYLGQNKTLLLGGGVSVVRPGMRFNASQITVDVSTRDILASGGVIAEIEQEMLEQEPEELPVNATAMNETIAVFGNLTDGNETVVETRPKQRQAPIMSLEGLFPSDNKAEPRKKSLEDLVVPKETSDDTNSATTP